MATLNLGTARITDNSPCTHIAKSLVPSQDSVSAAIVAEIRQSRGSKASTHILSSSPLPTDIYTHIKKNVRNLFSVDLRKTFSVNFKKPLVFYNIL